VTLIERQNVRELRAGQLPYEPALVVGDLSFISVRKVLPALAAVAAADSDMLLLVKPQFEVGRERVGKGGVVRDSSDRRAAIASVADTGLELGLSVNGVASSGLSGPAGNRESFVWFGRGGCAVPVDVETALEAVEPTA
jgi:23S rRNA (cytidine1920-2'-O)/16S rRNA (cytidine1409-2'-O)-methyltransferase